MIGTLGVDGWAQALREPARAPGQTTFRAPPLPSPSPLPPLVKSGGPGVSPPVKFFETYIAVGEIWCILGELMNNDAL